MGALDEFPREKREKSRLSFAISNRLDARMRELHLKLRTLSLDNAPCHDSERYPFLKELITHDKKLHSNWKPMTDMCRKKRKMQ